MHLSTPHFKHSYTDAPKLCMCPGQPATLIPNPLRTTHVFTVPGSGKTCSHFARGYQFFAKQGSYSDSTTRAEPERFLFEVFPSPKEGQGSSAHIRSAHSEKKNETVQVQNAYICSSNTLCGPRRLVHIHRPEGRLNLSDFPLSVSRAELVAIQQSDSSISELLVTACPLAEVADNVCGYFMDEGLLVVSLVWEAQCTRL